MSIFLMFYTCLAAALGSVDASNAFLQAQAWEEISKVDVERFITGELSGLSGQSQVDSLVHEMGIMYAALPKGQHGRLEPSTVRYALHRYFVHKHGWVLNGLDPVGGSRSANSRPSIMKQRAPAYIQSIFEQRLKGEGFGLRELAAFAATITDLVHAEAVANLQGIFAALDLPTSGPIERKDADFAVKAWLVTFLLGGNATISNQTQVSVFEADLRQYYPSWPDTLVWAQDTRKVHDLHQQSLRNPFMDNLDTFESSAEFVLELRHRMGSFQNIDCHQLKDTLLEMEHQGTGRVHLSRFYKGMVDGTEWQFGESIAYLRNMGALDETDPHYPTVVIPNYVNSRSNCLTSSSFYSVCCLNECENLMGHIEQDIAAPLGDPVRIAEVVAGLQSDTVEAPRNLSSPLLMRLYEIANRHSGVVPLQGRLFAQWMHHAYPRECPFPHVAGTTTPMTPEEWVEVWGPDSYVATQQQMKHHVGKVFNVSSSSEEQPLPWSAVEELVAEHRQMPRRRSWCARTILALTALLSLAVPLLRSARSALQWGSTVDKVDKCLV